MKWNSHGAKWRLQRQVQKDLIVDNWYKLRIVNRRDDSDVEHAYVTGRNILEAKHMNQLHLGPGYIVSIKPITYEQIIHELNRDPSH